MSSYSTAFDTSCEHCGAVDDGTQDHCDQCGEPLVEDAARPDDSAGQNPSRDGELYQLWTFANCYGCETWWRRRTEARYHAADSTGYPYPIGWGEHVRYLTDWEEAPRGECRGASHVVWTCGDPEKHCPNCSAAAQQLTMEV